MLHCALLVATIAAQLGTIAGTVRNANTREVVEGALVRVSGTSYRAITTANGAFTILGVPPGTYSVSARRLGFATHELTGIDVISGRTRLLAFSLRVASVDSLERAAFAASLVDAGVVGPVLALNVAQLAALPALTLGSALSLNGGYLELPSSSGVLSLGDMRRGISSLPSVRGARPDATLYLVDGIDASNPVLGSPPLMLDPLAVSSLTISQAYATPEHGGALSGLVEQTVREGSNSVSGSFEFETSAIPGRLGDNASGTSRLGVARGYLAGVVPGTGDALRFMISGHSLGERATVSRVRDQPWRGLGDLGNDQLIAKLTYALKPSLSLSVLGIGQHRSTLGTEPGILEGDSVAPPSVRDDGRFFVARVEKHFSRATLSLSAAHRAGARETCSHWQGVCVEDRLARVPVGAEIPAFGEPPLQTPYRASGQYFGGESFRSKTLRADIIALPSDHHQVRAGMYATWHDITYRDAIGFRWAQGVVLTARDVYRVKPTELSTYVQDAIAHDLITINIGARFDYSRTGGVAFANPLDPTNGTTAAEICNGTAPGLSAAPFSYEQYTGLDACLRSPVGASGRPVLIDSATAIARLDDFRAVLPRAAFAPRLGMSFPLTEQSGLFLNIGRYARNPLYHDVFRDTGRGSRAGLGEGADRMCDALYGRPGTGECAPNMALNGVVPEFIGNPDLSFQMADGFEAGFATQVGPTYAMDASVYSNTQSHLPRLYHTVVATDIGLTYGVFRQGAQRTVLSRGSNTAVGVSVTVRRRMERSFSYVVNYSWQRSEEIGGNPDLVAESLTSGAPLGDAAERIAARGRAHALNGMITWQWREDAPAGLGALLRNSRTTATLYTASGSQHNGSVQPSCPPNVACAPLEKGIVDAGTIVNMLYVRTLTTTGPRWAITLRVRNLFDADDGTRHVDAFDVRRAIANGNRPRPAFETLSLRRVLMGVGVSF